MACPSNAGSHIIGTYLLSGYYGNQYMSIYTYMYVSGVVHTYVHTVEPHLSEPQLTGCLDYPAFVAITKMATLSSEKSNSRKRKCVVLTLEDKIAVLDRLKDGATQEKLVDEYLHTVLRIL